MLDPAVRIDLTLVAPCVEVAALALAPFRTERVVAMEALEPSGSRPRQSFLTRIPTRRSVATSNSANRRGVRTPIGAASQPPEFDLIAIASARAGCGVDRSQPCDHFRGRSGALARNSTGQIHGRNRLLREGRQQVPWPNRHAQRPDRGRPHRPRPELRRRERPFRFPPRLRRTPRSAPPSRSARTRARLLLGQARRSLFNAPIYANLFDAEDGKGCSLVWSRRRKASAD